MDMPPAAFLSARRLKIISHGQTGANRGALDWALERGIAHGGWCPRGRHSESGPIPSRYHLVETPESTYLQALSWNVRDSDGTVIVTLNRSLSGHALQTARFADLYGKPWIHIRPAMGASTWPSLNLLAFVNEHDIARLNVTGTRNSRDTEIYKFVQATFDQAFAPA